MRIDRVRFAVPFLAASLLTAGCRTREAAGVGDNRPAASARESTGVVGSQSTATLSALEDSVHARALRADTVGLLRLLVNDSVYRRFVYPLSPAHDSTREEVFEFVLGMNKANSNKGLRRFLHDVRAEAARLDFAYDSTVVPGARLYRDPVRLSPGAGLRLFGSALCHEGGCQVLSFAKSGLSSGDEATDSVE